jgi:hypothetical protein
MDWINRMIRIYQLIATLALGTMLMACGTDSSSGGDAAGSSTASPTTGVTVSGVSSKDPAFSLRLTDAPIDNMVAVVLSFTEIQVHNAKNQVSTYRFDIPRSVNLLALQGSKTADLLINMPLDDGDYHDIRLLVDNAPMANYVDLGAGGLVELEIIDGSTTGIMIEEEFSVTNSRPASLVLDFDLRQSVKLGITGKYEYEPEIRLISQGDSGHIRGKVDPALLSSAPQCSDNDVDTFNAVYVFNGHNAKLDDIDQTKKSKKPKKPKKSKKAPKSAKATSSYKGPITTTVVKYDGTSMTYMYEAAFLPPGKYTVAVTCNADLEDLDKGGDNLRFFGVRNATVKVNDILFL